MRNLLLALVLLLGLAPGARADDDPDTEVARRRFQKGALAYEKADYATALREFQAARAVKPLPAFDFNIARCLDRLERWREAIVAYERFMSQTADPFEIEEARERVRILKTRLSEPSEPEVRAQGHIERGVALFQDGKLGEAHAEFELARKLVPMRPNAYRWLGLTEAGMSRCKDAVRNLDIFVSRVSDTDPRVIEALAVRNRCKEDLSPRGGTAMIESTPPGAEIRLDDEKARVLGRTPYRVTGLAEGAHVVFLRKAGYQDLAKGFTVRRMETLRLDFALRPAPAPTVLASAGKGAGERRPPARNGEKNNEKISTQSDAPPRSDEVEPREETEPEPPAPRRRAPRREEEGARPPLLVPILVGAAGLALLGTGVALIGSVAPEYGDLERECNQMCPPERWRDLELRANAGYALAAIGGVALAADVVLWVLAVRRPAARRVWVAPALAGTSAGIVVGGRF